jgi:hypothetical protein
MHGSPNHKDQGDHDGESQRDQCGFLSEFGLKEFVDPVDGVGEGGNEDQ